MHESPEKATSAANDNPFLEPLEAYLSDEGLERRLSNWPLAGVDVKNLNMQARHDLLDRLQDQMFEPTLSAIDTTTRLYRMIRRGYTARNPASISYKQKTMSLARWAGKELDQLPWLANYAKGIRICGITGSGKTYEILRALTRIPQCIVHGKSLSADWNHMVQAPWLYVAMSHDGSLGGLLLQILTTLDAAIGTTYARDRGITGLSNEKLAVQVGIILINHGVGVLVIDELQGRNFAGGARGGLAATFFLRLLNFGIPLVLMGNPFGMDALDSFSQDMRRVGSGGSIEMHPLESYETDFTDTLAPALWRYNVMPEPSPIQDEDGAILFKYCGGIRDYAARIRACSQRIALDEESPFVTEEHMEQAFNGPDFSTKERDLIAGFRDKNPILLQQFDDIPWRRYASRWGLHAAAPNASAPASPEPAQPSPEPEKPRKPASQKAREAALGKRTRKANEKAENAASRADLDPEDMRKQGLQNHLISGLAQLQSNSQPQKSFAPKGV
ncbi:ATP-binding protein [Pseudoduganella aquatica]|uniref:ATP-binding protein n=1 Tax=Pseudoduganella aquatica TaxID=2660641 RepID=UPI001E3823FE|nr:ATP-binding protein [Pseudoduganella aquatica]